MPPLSPLALRYLFWLVGLRFLYTVFLQVTGLPSLPSANVLFAALPAADIGYQLARRAVRDLVLRDWATVWAMMLGIYLALNVGVPAVVVAPFREALTDPAALGEIGTIIAATAGLMALFLWLGGRMVRADR